MPSNTGAVFFGQEIKESVSKSGLGGPQTSQQKVKARAAGSYSTFGGPADSFKSLLEAHSFDTQRHIFVFGSKFPTIFFVDISQTDDPLALLKPNQS